MNERNARDLRGRADEQAARLAPRGVAPEFLAESIWHRSLVGPPPSDEEVVEYLARCASDHVPVSGRQEHQPAIQPIERYRVGEIVIEVRRAGRGSYHAAVVGTREHVCGGRTRTIVHREVERRHPGGTWSAQLAQRDAAEVRRRWGL